MAFDNIPMTRPALMTAAAALAMYDAAVPRTFAEACDLADKLAAALRAAPKAKAPATPKVKPTGFRVDLVAGLKLINRIVERRNTVPILSDVRLTATGDTLTLMATDLDMFAEIVIPAPGIGCWTTTAGAKALGEIVSKGKGDVLLAPCPETGRLEVMVGEAVTALPSLDPADFPELDWVEPSARAFTMGAAPLLDMMRFVRPAVSTEETRYYLNGIYFHTVTGGNHPPKLRLVATDGHRMNLDEIDLPAGAENLPGVIVPRKAIDVLAHVLKDRETVEIDASPQRVTYRTGNVTFTTKVIDGAFPDYMRVVPRDLPETFALNTAAFVDGVNQVATISNEKSRSVRLDFASDKVTLTVRNMEAGRAEITLPAPHTGSDGEMSVGFNAKYVIDACAVLGAEEVQFSFSCPASPAIMRAACQPSRTTVLMPLRV